MRKLLSHSYALAFLAGFFSLSLEILGTNITFAFFTQSSEAMALALSAFLCGLSLGSWITQRYNASLLKHFHATMFLAFLLLAIFAGPVLGNFDRLQLFLVGKDEITLHAQGNLKVFFISLCFLNLFLPAILIGLIFPLANDRVRLQAGTPTGKVNLSDLLGAVAGALVAGFFLIPLLGLSKSFALLSLTSLAIALFLTPWKTKLYPLVWLAGAAVVLLSLIRIFPLTTALEFPKNQTILFQENSKFGAVTVVRVELSPDKEKMLYINYRPMCTSNVQGSISERKLASLLATEDNLTGPILNIGLGCGMTAAEVLRTFPQSALDIVEINQEVAEANSSQFHQENDEILKNPRVTLHIADGYNFLKAKTKKYQRIIIDIEEPTILQSSALYTKEGFELAKENLSENGVLGLWSLYQPETAKIILNTLRATFTYAEVYPSESFLLFFASDRPLPAWDERDQLRVGRIESVPLKLIARVKENPYPRYYDVNKVMGLETEKRDPFEIKKAN